MAKNFKWGAESSNDAPVYVVLFVSRNKDNKDVEGFTERRYSFVTRQAMNSGVLVNQFKAFADSGVVGEMSRMYYSVNARDASKVYKEFVKFLVDNPDFNLCSVQPKIAGIAAKKECAAEKKWFFDFDIDSEDEVGRFRDDILALEQDSKKPIEVTVHRTPHGYAVETSRGFDVRPLYEKWDRSIIDLKRDDLICCHWLRKHPTLATRQESTEEQKDRSEDACGVSNEVRAKTKMTEEERKVALYCLKANSDYHSEVCEECVNYPNCDHTIQDDVTETIIRALEQEPCDDAISRQYLLENCVVDKITMPYVPVSKIESAPPVTPNQKMGRWMAVLQTSTEDFYACSECGRRLRLLYPYNLSEYPYCHCGAKMKVENDG